MMTRLRFRVFVFFLAIAAALSLILWTAQAGLKRVRDLGKKLTSDEFKRFEVGEALQQQVLSLNNILLRYAISRDPEYKRRFTEASKALDDATDEWKLQKQNSLRENQVLDKINTEYDVYLAVTANILKKVESAGSGPISLNDFSAVEVESNKLLKDLSDELGDAHHEALASLLKSTNQSLVRLRDMLLGASLLLLVLAGGLAFVLYREMIAPLQVKLVESQALIERSQKLASLGMLAAGVAHEIRNPLTAIKARLFTLQKRLAADSPNSADAQVIAQEINRLERIVKEVLQFARPSEPQLVALQAVQPLREAHALMAVQLEKMNIQLVLENSPPAHIKVDLQQIKQVLINLIQNAADSIDKDGAVRLRARLDRRRLSAGATDVVILEVADTGKGISPEVQKRIFDPFFSTKEAGTGLGLSIAARIVEKHGGALQYQTEVNRGTTFGIVLPRIAKEEISRSQ
jgi:signal transduction histidine kinase